MTICKCGYLNNEQELSRCSSGGLATAIAIQTIQNNGLVYGVAYSSDFKSTVYLRVDKPEDVYKIQGTKYLRTTIEEGLFETIINDLHENRRVVFFGLPCHVAALLTVIRNREGISYDNLLTIDLICQGPTRDEAAEQFINWLEKKHRSSVVELSVRYKNPNWHPPYLFVKFQNGDTICKQFYRTYYGKAFRLLTCRSCYNCHYKGDNHIADMTIGDYWGISDKDMRYNTKGVSIVFIHSKKASSILDVLDSFRLFDADYNEAIRGNPMYVKSKARTKEDELFEKEFMSCGLIKACWKSMSLKEKIKLILP